MDIWKYTRTLLLGNDGRLYNRHVLIANCLTDLGAGVVLYTVENIIRTMLDSDWMNHDII